MLIYRIVISKKGFPGGSDGKESSCNVGDLGSILGLGRSPEGGRANPLQYSCLENPHGQRCLEGYSPWGRKELVMTGQLSRAQHTSKQRRHFLISQCTISLSNRCLRYVMCNCRNKILKIQISFLHINSI